MVVVAPTKFNLIVQEPIIRESLSAEVASIIQQLSEVTGCSCADVSLSRHSTTNQRGKPVLLLCLSFASSGDLFNESLARSFCRAVMHPSAHEILARLSESALLGLSPVDGSDLSECWNMTVLDTVYVYGAETMERPQKKALSVFNPSLRPAWFKVVTFVMDTTIEQTFSTNPYRHNLDLDSINRAREKRAVAKTASRGFLGTAEGLSMQYMRQTAKENCVGKSSEEKINAVRALLGTFFTKIHSVEQAMNEIVQDDDISPKKEAALFTLLYDFTVDAFNAFTATEELVEIYFSWMVQHSLFATIDTIGALLSGTNAYLNVTARAAVKNESWLTGLGRSMGLVTSAAPSVVRNELGKAALFSGVLSVWSVGSAVYNSYHIIKNKSRKDFAEASVHLVRQTWLTAAKVNTMLRWVKTTDGSLHFIGHRGRDWEEFLKERIGDTLQEEWKSPEYLRRYLNGHREDLKETRTELAASLVKVFL